MNKQHTMAVGVKLPADRTDDAAMCRALSEMLTQVCLNFCATYGLRTTVAHAAISTASMALWLEPDTPDGASVVEQIEVLAKTMLSQAAEPESFEVLMGLATDAAKAAGVELIPVDG